MGGQEARKEIRLDKLIVTKKNNSALIKFNRPEKLYASSQNLIEDMREALIMCSPMRLSEL